jgi:hypothetical protein
MYQCVIFPLQIAKNNCETGPEFMARRQNDISIFPNPIRNYDFGFSKYILHHLYATIHILPLNLVD